MASEVMRIDVGFQVQALSLRTTKEAYDGLVKALDGDRDGWHSLDTQDAEILIDLRQVVYVRRDTEEQRVGF